MKKTFAIIPVSKFSDAKTRLSPKLTVLERENLLKAMLKDVIKALNGSVENTVIISSDDNVLNYANDLGVITLKENGVTDLNGALAQAMRYCSNYCDNVLIIPSDVPLIKKSHVNDILNKSKEFNVIIAPAKGGGTNTLLCPSSGFSVKFGDYSFFEHIKEAKKKDLIFKIYDSFYLSLDVNTAEDLGEIMLHGDETEARAYLRKIHLKVRSNHGSERLNVNREVSA
ncbi:MAG: 2-phospho-L-lactate guanylyltransferase [Methanobacterium sp.]|uniref:2-phospho-L-lactate guanylyltransferase n=1 Tax=Methanobacterium sp. TaxID=2164 RepID=UPI003D653D25|nr:2-phospho-L-lactate guanylyltransferase [Methanobacterium sp.]